MGVETVDFMPRELTAQNGAKALLIGEFHEMLTVSNPDYCGCDQSQCKKCDPLDVLQETIPEKVTVQWSTIKAIYKMAVNHFERIAKEKREADRVKTVASKDALSHQEGGDHYQSMAIQPIEFIHANGLDFAEGSVVKYVSRHRRKNGVEDLLKAKHFIDLLIDLEYEVSE